ncbi:DoxX family membrane protein [Photobacterium profundum]|uniref:DoxX family membrane protein n=1 Tax=Photobacterium profundum TaxID=74109 RepID=UPI003D0AECE1
MNNGLIIAGRVLLGLYFLVPGIMKFVAWDMHVGLMAKHGMVFIPLFLAAAAIFQIIAGSALIVNRYTGIVSILLALLVLAINVNLHDFWNLDGLEGAHEMQNFIKNMGIFAGLLILAGHNLPKLAEK